MNKDWSLQNKAVQQGLSKAAFPEGINQLMQLRQTLADTMLSWQDTLSTEDFCAVPFPRAEGYHSKTIAYSIWHIMRIEDIVANTLIGGQEQVFFRGGYDQSIGSPIITTGNELAVEELAAFSRQLKLGELYRYMLEVKGSTDEMLQSLNYADLKRTFSEEDRQRIAETHTVSQEETAAWLIDYWCGKDVTGLIRMPFSRHWIMHIEAAQRIRAGIHR